MLTRLRHFLLIKFSLGRDPARRIISFWKKGGPDFGYFASAEDPRWLENFWQKGGLFRELFSRLDLSATLEIACGAGRHSWQVHEQFGQLYLLDSSEGALDLARKRFAGMAQVIFLHHPSGTGLPEAIPDRSLTAVFSYDAMVHFEKDTVRSYLLASSRVLRSGGQCLLHYSNYQSNPDGVFSDNPGWRNYMTPELFLRYVNEAGLILVETHLIDFSAPASDALSLLRKP